MILQPNLQIAVGNNNIAGLVAIESIIPINDRRFFPVRNYGTYDIGERKNRLNGRPYFAGRARVQFISGVMTQLQFSYLKDTYCGSGYSGLVTIRVRTDDPALFDDYNAILILPKEVELEHKNNSFIGVIWDFINLEVIP